MVGSFAPFRINRTTMQVFAFCQILVVFLMTPRVSFPGNNVNFGDEMDSLSSMWNQSQYQREAKQPETLPKKSAIDVHVNVPNSHAHDDDGCQRQIYHITDLDPNIVFPGTKIFHPPPVPLQAFNDTISSVQLGIEPRYGSHNCRNNAILSFVYGYQLPQIIHFVSTLLQSGFQGDLVLGVTPDLTDDTRAFLQQLTQQQTETTKVNLVVYEVSLTCSKRGSQFLCQNDQMFQDASSKEWIADFRPLRRVATLRFEYYWAWSSVYSTDSQLFVTDARDVYFQGNPIPNENRFSNTTLVLFEEAATIEQSRANSNWLKRTYSEDVLEQVKSRHVICSGTTLGGQPAMEAYARAMVHEFDRTNCKNCGYLHDQCFHNYLAHLDQLVGANGGKISNVEVHQQGKGGIVNTVGLVSKRNNGASLKELGLVQNGTMAIFDNDKATISAVIHMFDRDPEMKEWVQSRSNEELMAWNLTRTIDFLVREEKMVQHQLQIVSEMSRGADTAIIDVSPMIPIREAPLSDSCLSQSRDNRDEFQAWCKRILNPKTSCQRLQMWNNYSHSTPDVIVDSSSSRSSPCKTLWVTGMSWGFENATSHEVANGGDGYATQYAAALASARQNAGQVLQPVVILLTPETITELPAFAKWLEAKNVIVIHIHEVSFQDLVFKHYPEYASNGAIAYYLRFDIPKLVIDHNLLEEPGICTAEGNKFGSNSTNDVILYTDSDVLFVQPLPHHELAAFKQTLLNRSDDVFLMYGHQQLIDQQYKPKNTGVMLMNVQKFVSQWPNILRWGKRQSDCILKPEESKHASCWNYPFPPHDQVWLNRYYNREKRWRSQNLLLPPTWNWKVYWDIGAEALDIQETLSQIRIVHFHGPKIRDGVDEMARCDMEGALDPNAVREPYKEYVAQGICCDRGRTASLMLRLYEQWRPQAKQW